MLATIELCFLCFESIISQIDRIKYTSVFDHVSKKQINEKYPMFVTWKLHGNLRGCIGSFEPSPLYQGLIRTAKSAAFHDDRFPPIKKHEIPKLECTVSLLHSFEDAENVFDWEIGKHGIILTIKNQYRATFLPEVMEEQKWTKQQTLLHLARKAGYNGKIDEDLWKSCTLQRYQSSLATTDYQHYLDFQKELSPSAEDL